MKSRLKTILRLSRINLMKRKRLILGEVLVMLIAMIVEVIGFKPNPESDVAGLLPISLFFIWIVAFGLIILVCIMAYKTYSDDKQLLYVGGKVEYVAGRMLCDYINIGIIVLMQGVVYTIEPLVIKLISSYRECNNLSALFSVKYLLAGLIQSFLLGSLIYAIYSLGYAIFQKWYIPSIVVCAGLFMVTSWIDTFANRQISVDTGMAFAKLYLGDSTIVVFILITLLSIIVLSGLGCLLAKMQSGFRSHDYSFITAIIITGVVVVFILLEPFYIMKEDGQTFGEQILSEDGYLDGMVTKTFEIEVDSEEAFAAFVRPRSYNSYDVQYGEDSEVESGVARMTRPILFGLTEYYGAFTVSEAHAAGLAFDESKVDSTHALLIYGYKSRVYCGMDLESELFEGLNDDLEFVRVYMGKDSDGNPAYNARLIKKDADIKAYIYNFGFACADRFLNENHSLVGSSYRYDNLNHTDDCLEIACYLIYQG